MTRLLKTIMLGSAIYLHLKGKMAQGQVLNCQGKYKYIHDILGCYAVTLHSSQFLTKLIVFGAQFKILLLVTFIDNLQSIWTACVIGTSSLRSRTLLSTLQCYSAEYHVLIKCNITIDSFKWVKLSSIRKTTAVWAHRCSWAI